MLSKSLGKNIYFVPRIYADELIQDERLMPIVQNIRGCPYLCRYCVSGTQFGKIRNFSYERITEEINFLKGVVNIAGLPDDNKIEILAIFSPKNLLIKKIK